MRTIYRFIPHEKLTLETHLSQEEILKRIRENTTDTPIQGFRWLQKGSASDRRFTGKSLNLDSTLSRTSHTETLFSERLKAELNLTELFHAFTSS